MFERECTVYAFLLGYARRLVADIDDARFADQPSPGVNHPAWLLGHLAVVADSAAGLFGESRLCPRRWQVDFGTGSQPRPDRGSYLNKGELLTALEAGHERLARLARGATPEALEGPHTVDVLLAALPTKADLLAHVLTSHEALHIGHLSNWRRQMGMPYLF
jgi:hypothetical protein